MPLEPQSRLIEAANIATEISQRGGRHKPAQVEERLATTEPASPLAWSLSGETE